MRATNSINGVEVLPANDLAERDTLDAVYKELQRRLNGIAAKVSCELTQGGLRLKGQLSTYYQKQLAQEAAFGVSRGRRVVNEIRVVPMSAPAA